MKEILLIVTIFLNVYLFFYLYSRRDYQKRKEYTSTYITLISSTVWILTNLLFQIFDPSLLYWVAILSYISAVGSLLGVLLFLLVYNQDQLPRQTMRTILFHLLLAFIVSTYVAVPGLVLEKIITVGDTFKYITTPYLTAYGAYIAFLFFSIIYSGILTYQRLSPDQRQRTKLFLYSSVFAIGWSIIFNLLLPILGHYQYTWIGPISMAFWVSTMIYSIVRYRLFDIRFGIGYSIYSILSASFTVLFFYAVYYLQTLVWGNIFSRQAIISGLFLAIGYIKLQKVVDEFIFKQIEKVFIYSGTAPVQIIQELAKRISVSLDIDDISENVILSINRVLDTKEITIASLEAGDDIKLYVKSSSGEQSLELSEFRLLMDFWNLDKKQITLIRAELESKTQSSQTHEAPILNLLQKYECEVVIPLIALSPKVQITGAIMIGRNERNRPYTDKEVSFLEDISQICSVSFNRALLHREVQQFSVTLQQKVTDATRQLKERNKELQDLYDNLEELYQKEKDLMDIAGHEFRTPASILKNNLYLLKKRIQELLPDQSDEKINKYVQRLIEGTERQIKLVNTFLESARIDNKRFELEVEMTDLAAIVTKAVSELKHFAKEKDLELIYRQPKGKIFAEVDVIRIREVIDNLINNAIKYTKQGYIEIQLSETKEKVTFSVKDTGIGIKKEDQALLFKKFSRVENYIGGEEGSIVRPGGTGLGLYVAKTIVDAHSGTIGVESNVGQGSLFFFELPHTQPSYMKRANGPRTKIVMSPLSSSGIGATTGQKLPEGSKVTSALSDVTTVSIGKSSDTSTGQPTNSPATTLSTSASGKTPEITETQSVSMPQPTGGQSA